MINRINCHHPFNFGELAKNAAGRIEELQNRSTVETFQPTYLEALDYAIDGLEPGKVTAVVGRPSMGKTIFAMNIARNVAVNNTPVLVVSLSLDREDWARTLLCSIAKVDLHKARVGTLDDEESARFNEVVETNACLPIFIEAGARQFNSIVEAIKRSIREHHVELIIIDGLSDIYGNELNSMEERGRRYDQQLKMLKAMTVVWNIPVLVTQTLSRRFERNPHISVSRHEFGPMEGNLCTNVDRILHLYREEYYNPTKKNHGHMDIRIPAMKPGERLCSVPVYFDRSIGLVKDHERIPFNP